MKKVEQNQEVLSSDKLGVPVVICYLDIYNPYIVNLFSSMFIQM